MQSSLERFEAIDGEEQHERDSEDLYGGGGQTYRRGVERTPVEHFPQLWCSNGTYSIYGQVCQPPKITMHLVPSSRASPGALLFCSVCYRAQPSILYTLHEPTLAPMHTALSFFAARTAYTPSLIHPARDCRWPSEPSTAPPSTPSIHQALRIILAPMLEKHPPPSYFSLIA